VEEVVGSLRSWVRKVERREKELRIIWKAAPVEFWMGAKKKEDKPF
jgi:hypothetical protein